MRLPLYVSLLLGAATAGLAAQEATPANRLPPVRTAAVGGTTLAWTELGRKGRPVVFVHGELGDYRSWGLVVLIAGRDRNVITFSRRYHWPNTPVAAGQDYDPALQLADLIAFIEKVGRGPVHLVGYSYGAELALRLLLQRPELVRSVVLTEPGINAIANRQFALIDPLARRLGGWTEVDSLLAAGDTVGALEGTVTLIDGPEAMSQLTPAFMSQLVDNLPAFLAWRKAPPLPAPTCNDLANINTPVLIVEGAQTGYLFRQADDFLMGCISTATRSVIPNADHTLIRHRPQAFTQVVLAFLASLQQ
jgi:pimeloyl-ACP methyl ester carboxylesterase